MNNPAPPDVFVIAPFQSKPPGKFKRLVSMWRRVYCDKLVNNILTVMVAIPMFGAGFAATHYGILSITSSSFAHPALSQNLPEYFLSGFVLAVMGLVFMIRYNEEEPTWFIAIHCSGFAGLLVGFLATCQL